MEKIVEYRNEIEKIDAELAKLLQMRIELSLKIGEYKKEHGLPVFDAQREELLKQKNTQLIKAEYQRSYLEIFETILKVSKELQL